MSDRGGPAWGEDPSQGGRHKPGKVAQADISGVFGSRSLALLEVLDDDFGERDLSAFNEQARIALSGGHVVV